MRKEQHIIQLDGLRFYAVFMVMIAHWLQWKWTKANGDVYSLIHH